VCTPLHSEENKRYARPIMLAPPYCDAVSRELERVLASSLFGRSEQLSRLLRFIVERSLHGREGELKESVIAVEVFGRSPDYDPRRDPIVRTEARRLRTRLAEYYRDEGRTDPWVILLPKGGYVPVFRNAETEPQPLVSVPSVPSVLHARPRRSNLWAFLVLVAVAVSLGSSAWWWLQGRAPIRIAVLPLDNLNHASSDDYFSDGLTDEIIRNLAIIDGLAVRSQTSSFAFKGKPHNIRDTARQLDAEYILEGSVLRAGGHLRIDVQLVRACDDSPVWSQRYDRVLTDVFVIQDEISRGIVNSLRVELGRGRRRYETSIEAYDLYLRARSMVVQYGFAGHEKSVPIYEQTIAKDPYFEPAYAGLAVAESFLSNQAQFDSHDARLKMEAAAETAIKLDPLSAEANEAMAFAYDRAAKWNDAEESFRRALKLESHNSIIRSHFAISHLLPLGRVSEALRELRTAERDDPLSAEVHQITAQALLMGHRWQEAAVQAGKMPDGSTLKSAWLGRALFFQGHTDEAIRRFGSSYDVGLLGYAYGKTGRIADAEKLAAGITDPTQQALIFAGLGDRDRAFEALERAVELGPVRLGRLLNYPEMAFLREDPRAKALRKRLGLPE
jgi:adenylate cyclase